MINSKANENLEGDFVWFLEDCGQREFFLFHVTKTIEAFNGVIGYVKLVKNNGVYKWIVVNIASVLTSGNDFFAMKDRAGDEGVQLIKSANNFKGNLSCTVRLEWRAQNIMLLLLKIPANCSVLIQIVQEISTVITCSETGTKTITHI